ncbi:PRTRC system protein A [Burkholderia multivorans]|uniref:PRTRC system protein A n=1 Tax=Burkholderia multivorans TaxID=87883 RepID=A0AB37ALS6_9BURK|nr:PRTRC system protein A [Burkholderia multivorans]MBU9589494.1 PRTRC system protein A [Burkholderia multivorans]PRE41333.1 PRTRC system protein A [Burkholderia multivorans]PRE54567.1 PRTRC system protein A [Burkholderia multivorans]
MNAVDTVLQQSFPSVMVPSREAVVPMTRSGERLLITSDGVYLEVLRPWVRVVRRIAHYAVSTAVPYGQVEETTAFSCGQIPAALVAEFHAMARAALPNEVGAWIVWNSMTGAFRIVALPSASHGPGHLVYERPRLADGEWLVVDCHSHGTGSAFFSRTDNQDDKHDVKLALVLGHCDRTPSVALRLCAKGIFEKFERVPESWAIALTAEVV